MQGGADLQHGVFLDAGVVDTVHHFGAAGVYQSVVPQIGEVDGQSCTVRARPQHTHLHPRPGSSAAACCICENEHVKTNEERSIVPISRAAIRLNRLPSTAIEDVLGSLFNLMAAPHLMYAYIC
jgi:hypothetical protein